MAVSDFPCALISPTSGSLTQSPPVHLGYLAAALLVAGYDARIFDFKRLDAKEEELFERIIAFAPRLIGITSVTVEMPGASRLIEKFRRRLPDAKIALGGVHPTALPERTLEETGADFVARGEGEKILENLIKELSSANPRLETIPGITYSRDGAVTSNPPETPIENLDALPFPAWAQMPPAAYSAFTMQLYKRRPVVAPILTSRGCPFSCAFCASRVHGLKIRSRAPARVADELEMLARDFSLGEFLILDDNFTQSKAHALAVCEEIIRRKLDLVWRMPQGMRADTVDEELIRAFKRSGCYEVGFGIESGNQKILDRARKKLDLSIVHDRIRMIKRHGLGVYGFFIIGLPGETPQTVMDTIRFMRRGFDHVSVSYCIPYPGSALYEDYVSFHGAAPDWGLYAHHHVFEGISTLSAKQMKYYMRRAVFGFYLHPRRFFGLLRKLKSIPLRYTWRLAVSYFGPGR